MDSESSSEKPNPERVTWAGDEAALVEIGTHFFQQSLLVRVRLPEALALRAVAAWRRDDDGNGNDAAGESQDQRTTRHRAATLALIGLAVDEQGQRDGEDVVVDLEAWHVGAALDAADAQGALLPPRSPQ